jgi:four helix bundle protein
MRDHRKLEAFSLAHKAALSTYKATRTFPKEEQFGLTAQMRRAAISVASNIVEGSARESKADYARFVDIAYGSAKELEYQVELARDLGYLDNMQFVPLSDLCSRSAQVLNALVRALRSR